jgi:NAD(P)-dependent dehydrogenase (short-subunit alcohol dehydrogenase family)
VEEAVKVINEMEREIISIKADVANDHEVKYMVQKAKEEFGSIDILVNNAALHRGGRIQKLPPEDWDLVINSVLRGVFNCCRYVLPFMVEKEWGRIINISSDAGLHGSPGDTAYGAAKAGLIGFTKSLAKEVAKKKITVNVVIPGFLQTDMTSVLFTSEERLNKETQLPTLRREVMKDDFRVFNVNGEGHKREVEEVKKEKVIVYRKEGTRHAKAIFHNDDIYFSFFYNSLGEGYRGC